METTLTDNEKIVLKEMYDKLSNTFGITLIENRLTLRFNKGKNLCVISMIIDNIDTGHDAQCYMCNGIFNDDEMYNTDVTVGTCVDSHKFKVKLCYDCYCPK